MDLDSIDLATIGSHLRDVYGSRVEGAIVGRTLLRDEVAQLCGLSLLQAEELIDTMIMRGLITEESRADGWNGWAIH